MHLVIQECGYKESKIMPSTYMKDQELESETGVTNPCKDFCHAKHRINMGSTILFLYPRRRHVRKIAALSRKGAIHKLTHTYFMIFRSPLPLLSQVVTFVITEFVILNLELVIK